MKEKTKIIENSSLENNFFAVKTPLVRSTTFERDKKGGFQEGQSIYSRLNNPNRVQLEKSINILENAYKTFSFSSGQAASMSIFHSLRPGKEVLIGSDRYHGTYQLLSELFDRWQVKIKEFDTDKLELLPSIITENTALIWAESCSNPLLKVTDIKKLSEIAKKHSLLLAIDNTFSSPFHCKPLNLGADIVMNSTSKFMGGHSDLIGGSISVSSNLDETIIDKISKFQKIGGAIPSPADCDLMQRSLETFHLRMPVHSKNALELAKFLEKHPLIESVIYPGLESHKNYAIASKQFSEGYGGVLSLLFKGNQKETLSWVSKLKIIKHATSLGGTESLIEHRRSVEGTNMVSPENLVRISAGLENIEDLIDDFEQSFIQFNTKKSF